MPSILVADKIAEPGLELLRKTSGITFDVRHGLSPAELSEVIGEYDGILIRSEVKLTKEALARPGKLSVIARAGVGVDNVDLDAATAAGVLVLNTPDANTFSTAEHTIAMILALHRKIPDAHQHVRSGQWKRSAFQGDQLAGTTLGVVGLGRIGRAVARRARAFEMKVIAFDPFVAPATAGEEGVTLAQDLPGLFAAADCITLHASLSSNTRHMIGKHELEQMKPGAKLVNCARGALVDEAALVDALNSGRLGGAAIDVFENEPPTNSPLLTAKHVVLTPHLAASTGEAQLRVSLDAVEAILAYLMHGEIRGAVNVTEFPAHITPRGRAYLDLASRMGAILAPWCALGVERVSVAVYGQALHEVATLLSWQVMASVVGPHLTGRLTLVNAREQAQRRGIVVDHATHSTTQHHRESVSASVESRGQRHVIEGTIYSDGRQRIMSIDGYPMEIAPERPLVLIFNDDRPGVIGLVGQAFGNAGINIADMALSRRGRTALMVLKLDSPMPSALHDQLRNSNPPILSVHTAALPPFIEEATET